MILATDASTFWLFVSYGSQLGIFPYDPLSRDKECAGQKLRDSDPPVRKHKFPTKPCCHDRDLQQTDRLLESTLSFLLELLHARLKEEECAP